MLSHQSILYLHHHREDEDQTETRPHRPLPSDSAEKKLSLTTGAVGMSTETETSIAVRIGQRHTSPASMAAQRGTGAIPHLPLMATGQVGAIETVTEHHMMCIMAEETTPGMVVGHRMGTEIVSGLQTEMCMVINAMIDLIMLTDIEEMSSAVDQGMLRAAVLPLTGIADQSATL